MTLSEAIGDIQNARHFLDNLCSLSRSDSAAAVHHSDTLGAVTAWLVDGCGIEEPEPKSETPLEMNDSLRKLVIVLARREAARIQCEADQIDLLYHGSRDASYHSLNVRGQQIQIERLIEQLMQEADE